MKPTTKTFLTVAGITGIFLLMAKRTGYRSFLGLQNYPRGIRNNNPGNIVFNNANGWKGKIPWEKNTDANKHFEQFEAVPYGIRAMIKLLRTYHGQGYKTIESILYKYAPTIENNTDAYIASVEQQTGVDRHATINVDSFIVMRALVYAISRHENGANYLIDSDITNAWALL